MTVSPDPEAPPPASAAQAMAPARASGDGRRGGLHSRTVSLDAIRLAPDHPRRALDSAALAVLAESIRRHGVLQPVLLRADAEGYVLVAGERRWRAARIAGLDAIPAIVTDLTGEAAMEVALIEHLHREDLAPMEQARMMSRMVETMGYSIRRLAVRLGKGKGHVEDRLRLIRLPDDLRELVESRPDTLTHVRELERVRDADARRALAEHIRREGMPLRELRERVRALGGPRAEGAGRKQATPPAAHQAAPAGPQPPGAPEMSIEQVIAACKALRATICEACLNADTSAWEPLMAELTATEQEVQALLVRVWTDSLVQQVSPKPPSP